MPFTPSHIVAVLPLSTGRPARHLAPGALVIGTMVPDLAYFVPSRLRPPLLDAGLSHTLLGVITVDLVYGLLVWLGWRLLLRAPVVDLLPSAVRHRLPGRARLLRTALPTAAEFGRAVPSVIIGALSHVVWDGFTHQGRWPVRQIGWLAVDLGGRPLYHWLQYASGVLGLVVLGLWIRHVLAIRPALGPAPADARARSELSDRLRHLLWVVGAGVLLASSLLVWALEAAAAHALIDRRVVVAVVTRGISVTGALVFCYALAHTLGTRLRPGVPDHADPADGVISKTP